MQVGAPQRVVKWRCDRAYGAKDYRIFCHLLQHGGAHLIPRDEVTDDIVGRRCGLLKRFVHQIS